MLRSLIFQFSLASETHDKFTTKETHMRPTNPRVGKMVTSMHQLINHALRKQEEICSREEHNAVMNNQKAEPSYRGFSVHNFQTRYT